jgi:hypothetical protein
LRLDSRLDQRVLIGNDSIFDEEGEGILEEALHSHIGVLLFFVDGLNDIVVGAYALVIRFVIGCLLDLNQRVIFELLLGK